jgi:soluble lytic murein transglycosylase
LCGLYASVDRGWRRYALATATVKDTTLRRAPTASNLWAWQCLFPRPYGEAVARLEERYRLPTGLLHSVMRQESAFRPDAKSPAGAIGLMQLMPRTAERAAVELDLSHRPDRLEQVQYNLELGAFYLGKLLDDFDRQVVLALASYNAGPHAAMRWLDGGQDLPLDLWVARIPFTETRHYVTRVMANWARYRYLAGGPPSVPRVALDVPVGLELASNAY